MTDDVKWIVEALRMCPVPGYGCNDCPVYTPGKPCQNELNAANLIESLAAELEQVKRERDELLKQLRGDCGICAHWQECVDNDFALDRNYPRCWEWRGVKE